MTEEIFYLAQTPMSGLNLSQFLPGQALRRVNIGNLCKDVSSKKGGVKSHLEVIRGHTHTPANMQACAHVCTHAHNYLTAKYSEKGVTIGFYIPVIINQKFHAKSERPYLEFREKVRLLFK